MFLLIRFVGWFDFCTPLIYMGKTFIGKWRSGKVPGILENWLKVILSLLLYSCDFYFFLITRSFQESVTNNLNIGWIELPFFFDFHPLFEVRGAPTKFGSRTVGPIWEWRSQQDFFHSQGSNSRPLVKSVILSPMHYNLCWSFYPSLFIHCAFSCDKI